LEDDVGKLMCWMQMSVDGFIEGPNREFDWPVFKKEMSSYALEQIATAGTFLYGRVVWEVMAGYWPTADKQPSSTDYDIAYAEIWRNTPKVVFSRSLDSAEWNTRVISDNLREEVMKLKEDSDKDLVLFGGADIASTLTRLGLIDEYRLFVHPVVLGDGTPLFKDTDRLGLRLLEACTLDSAVVLHRYARAARRLHTDG
jgi:dihydrofolate reductase